MARALAEPPPPDQRVECLREAARAEATAGRETACALLEQALSLADDPRERAEIALELAEVHSDLFQWVEAADVAERALAELGDGDEALAARLEGELVVAGLLDARRAARVVPVLERLPARPRLGIAAEAFAVARGVAMGLAGRPVDETAAPLEGALARASVRAENWTTRSVLLWTLVVCESFDAVEKALGADARGGASFGQHARPGCRVQHAGPAQVAVGRAARGRRRGPRRAARAARRGFRVGACVRGDGARRGRDRGR